MLQVWLRAGLHEYYATNEHTAVIDAYEKLANAILKIQLEMEVTKRKYLELYKRYKRNEF